MTLRLCLFILILLCEVSDSDQTFPRSHHNAIARVILRAHLPITREFCRRVTVFQPRLSAAAMTTRRGRRRSDDPTRGVGVCVCMMLTSVCDIPARAQRRRRGLLMLYTAFTAFDNFKANTHLKKIKARKIGSHSFAAFCNIKLHVVAFVM